MKANLATLLICSMLFISSCSSNEVKNKKTAYNCNINEKDIQYLLDENSQLSFDASFGNEAEKLSKQMDQTINLERISLLMQMRENNRCPNIYFRLRLLDRNFENASKCAEARKQCKSNDTKCYLQPKCRSENWIPSNDSNTKFTGSIKSLRERIKTEKMNNFN